MDGAATLNINQLTEKTYEVLVNKILAVHWGTIDSCLDFFNDNTGKELMQIKPQYTKTEIEHFNATKLNLMYSDED